MTGLGIIAVIIGLLTAIYFLEKSLKNDAIRNAGKLYLQLSEEDRKLKYSNCNGYHGLFNNSFDDQAFIQVYEFVAKFGEDGIKLLEKKHKIKRRQE